jgi:osmotically inducible protein OsmC
MSVRIKRIAEANWQGSVTEGSGRVGVGSGVFEGAFSLRARVEDAADATNPEELIGAGHAGCFTMALANLLSDAGHPPVDLRTTASVRLEQLDSGYAITGIDLSTVGDVPGVDAGTFARLAQEAKDTCPVSRALAGTEITLEAKLAGG